MKGTTLLERQHTRVEALFTKLDRAREERRQAIASELCDLLASHLTIEEQIFYPTVRHRLPPRAKQMVLESYEEHAAARFALERLAATPVDDETFDAKVKALRELVDDHVEEEEDDLFPLVEKHLTDGELTALGEEMTVMHEDCMREGHTKVVASAKRAHATATR